MRSIASRASRACGRSSSMNRVLHQVTAWRKAGRESRSNRLPEFVLGSPAQLASTTEKHVDGNSDKRVLRNPLSLSPALAVESPADPRQLIQLVGPEPEFLALEALPLG